MAALALAGCAGTAEPGDGLQPGGPGTSAPPSDGGDSLFEQAPPGPAQWTVHVDTPTDAMDPCWDDPAVQDVAETDAGVDVTLSADATQDDADRVRTCVEALPDHGTVVVYPPDPTATDDAPGDTATDDDAPAGSTPEGTAG